MTTKLNFLFLAFLFLLSSLYAQESRLKISSRVNSDRSVDFDFVKDDPGTFTVILNLQNLINSTAQQRQLHEVRGYQGKVFTLKPEKENQDIGISFSYGFIRGRLMPKYKKDFTYILPYSNGKKVKIIESGYLGEKYFGATVPDDWKAYNFLTKEEDTVVAIRKGVVVEVKDINRTDVPGNAVYTSSTNEIIVEHPGGSLARYRGFKKGIFVKVGETVYPATPLGINTRSNASSINYNISLYVFYLKSDDVESQKKATLKTSKSFYGFVTPHFFVDGEPSIVLKDETEYIAAITPQIKQFELSKKELKSLK